MIQRIYPQEEERWYITEDRYLLRLARKRNQAAKVMTPSEFARNIWLIEDERELWRIHTDEDSEGFPFSDLSRTYTEYLAYRESERGMNNTAWRINMSTGKATLFPKGEDRLSGQRLELYIRKEQRIYLPDHSYLLLPLFYNSNDKPRNITRVGADGKEIWRVSTTPEIDADPSYIYEYMYIYKDGRFVAAFDERVQCELDVETGKATPTYFPLAR